MSIDARIKTVTHTDQGNIVLRLAAYPHGDGTMSIPGVSSLVVRRATQEIHAGQQIWGNSGRVIVEAGQGGRRVEYKREGNTLLEIKGHDIR